MTKWSEIRARLYDTIGESNSHGVILAEVHDEETLKVEVICPFCGIHYEVSARQWKQSTGCADCRYERQYGHRKQSTHRNKNHYMEEIDMSDSMLAELLNPKAIWERIKQRNLAERHEELDEITIERKEMI